MKNRGFTLVELLAVITLMALLSLAAFELLDSVNKGNKEKAEAVQINNILTSATAYVPTSDIRLPSVAATDVYNGNVGFDLYDVTNGKASKYLSTSSSIDLACISLKYLQIEGVAEDNIKSAMTGEAYPNPMVCIALVNPSTKSNIEKQLKDKDMTWIYNGTYLYYFHPNYNVLDLLQ